MARWTDLSDWRGPTPNQGGGMVEHQGLVLHIAVGWYEGTIAWQRNPDSNVSSHFIVGRDAGEAAQMVDTAIRAWTQGDGNGRWLSSENEGFLASDRRNPGGWERLSAWQIEANARLLARAHQVYGVPLQVADHPGEKGLGHHSMDREWLDEQWGHDACPGAAIIAQKPAIVARAKEIVGGDDVDLNDRVDMTGPGGKRWSFGEIIGKDTISVNAALGYAAAGGWQLQQDVVPTLRALAEAVAGRDVAAAFRAELDRQTATLTEALDAATAERAELAELVRQAGAGELTAEQVVDELGRRLAAGAEPVDG